MRELWGESIKKWLRVLILHLLSEIWNYAYEIVLVFQNDILNAILPVLECQDEEAQK
jgi:hypothetical protein